MHKIVSPISKLFVGSHLHHEFILFRSLKFYVCVEFVNDHRIKMRVSTSEDYINMQRKKLTLVENGTTSLNCTLRDILDKCEEWIHKNKAYSVTENNC